MIFQINFKKYDFSFSRFHNYSFFNSAEEKKKENFKVMDFTGESKKRRHESIDDGDLMMIDHQEQSNQKKARYQEIMVNKTISQSSIVSHMPTYPHLIVFDAYLENMYAAK